MLMGKWAWGVRMGGGWGRSGERRGLWERGGGEEMGGGWEEECGEWKAIGEVVNKARKGKMAVAAMGGLVGNFKTWGLDANTVARSGRDVCSKQMEEPAHGSGKVEIRFYPHRGCAVLLIYMTHLIIITTLLSP